MFVITVTYGTRPHAVYATAYTQRDADKLRATAVRLGYDDAKVLPEKLFLQSQANHRDKREEAAAAHEQRAAAEGTRSAAAPYRAHRRAA